MVWIVLFIVYALVMLGLTGLGAAMGGSAAKQNGKPITPRTVIGMWLFLMTIPLWAPFAGPVKKLADRVRANSRAAPRPRRPR